MCKDLLLYILDKRHVQLSHIHEKIQYAGLANIQKGSQQKNTHIDCAFRADV